MVLKKTISSPACAMVIWLALLVAGEPLAASEYVSRPSERDFFYAAIKESAVPGRAAPEQR